MKPIIFSTPMVQAILDGRKTVTRRVVKPQNIFTGSGPYFFHYGTLTMRCSFSGAWVAKMDERTPFLPRYLPGDILYVRETFFCEPCTEDCAGRNDENECPFNRVGNKCYGYKTQYAGGRCDGVKWRPSIHMPKEAARIFLRITNVRVERLQEISEEDARAEGCIDYHDKVGDGKFEDVIEFDLTARDAFAYLWDKLNTKCGYSWDTNPWVWVYEFERLEVTP